MDNNRLDALLKRDTETKAGLLADQPLYLPLEAEIGPLRTEHAANLAKARDLEKDVMDESQDDSGQQKNSAKKQLKELGVRLAAALQAYAASPANKDEDLAGRVRYNRTSFNEAGEGSYATIVAALLKEAQPLTAELAKREFTADDLATTTQLLARFEKKQTSQRLNTVDGGTDRKGLIALLRRNSALIKAIRVQLKPYENSPAKHDVWLRFKGYTRVIVLGQGGSSATPPKA